MPSFDTAGLASAYEPEESLASDSDLEQPFVGRGSEASEVPESPSSATRSLSNYESGRSGGGEVDAAVQLEAAVSSSVRGPGQGRASSGLVGALSMVCHPAAHKRGVYLFSWPGSIQAYAANPTLAAQPCTRSAPAVSNAWCRTTWRSCCGASWPPGER